MVSLLVGARLLKGDDGPAGDAGPGRPPAARGGSHHPAAPGGPARGGRAGGRLQHHGRSPARRARARPGTPPPADPDAGGVALGRGVPGPGPARWPSPTRPPSAGWGPRRWGSRWRRWPTAVRRPGRWRRWPPDAVEVVALPGGGRLRCRRGAFLDRGTTRSFFLIEELTEELRQAEKSAYEKLIRMMAHEVNNSVAASNSLLHLVPELRPAAARGAAPGLPPRPGGGGQPHPAAVRADARVRRGGPPADAAEAALRRAGAAAGGGGADAIGLGRAKRRVALAGGSPSWRSSRPWCRWTASRWSRCWSTW